MRERFEVSLALAGALTGSASLEVLGVPGGAVVGGTIGGMCVVLVRDREIELSSRSRVMIQLTIGMLVGIRFTPGTVQQLGSQLLPAMMATAIVVVAGLTTGLLLRRFLHLPHWILLATSPGGLEAIVAVATERHEGPIEVALFHFVRILLVLLSIPLLVSLEGLGS